MDAKPLPPRPDIAQFEKEAKDRLQEWRSSGEMHRLGEVQFEIALEYGFESWPEFSKHIEGMLHADSEVSTFESAADAIIAGDIATLEALLGGNRALIHARSTRKHRATLLHYISANGVEDFRQKTPKNAVDVANVLLKAGAEVDAIAETYGGGNLQTTMNLLVSSIHPDRAGVQGALVETLLDSGAAVNGLNDDGSPLITALAFGYPVAAETLAKRGARVDTIVAAAGLGRADLVSKFLNDRGNLKLVDVDWVNVAKTAKANMELALIWAAALGRRNTVELLVNAGVDLAAKDHQGFNALAAAAFYRRLDVVDLLIGKKAPLESVNAHGGTVLGGTIWAALHHDTESDYLPIIERLLAAGARVDRIRSPTGNQRIDEVLRRHGAKS